MVEKRRIIFPLLFLLSFSLFPVEMKTGFSGAFSLGMGSGKGLWDTSTTEEQGELLPLPGGSVSYLANIALSHRIFLNMSIQYSYARAGQKVDNRKILYTQQSLDFPLLIMGTPLSEKSRLTLGAGPTLTYLPGKAERAVYVDNTLISEETAHAEQMVLFGIQAGADYTIPISESSDILVSFRFSHPFLSPVYHWDEEGSGNIRINRIELGFGILRKTDTRSSRR